MTSGPEITEFEDGRIHAQHGPIDLIITIDASPVGRARAVGALTSTFADLLEELVVDLELLRSPAGRPGTGTGATARRMVAATTPLIADGFITPMAAVAGSVADTICDAMWDSDLTRLIVNNGGDIAFRLSPESSLTVALADVSTGALDGAIRIQESDPVRGVATSGRYGRSLTMGVADSVTAFATSAASADAAATLIASSTVAPNSSRVRRRRACDIDANSDLGERLVVVDVEPLTKTEKDEAMERGMRSAGALIDKGVAVAIAIKLDDQVAMIGKASQDSSAVASGETRPDLARQAQDSSNQQRRRMTL